MAKTQMSHVREGSRVTFYLQGGVRIMGKILSLPSVHGLWVIERLPNAETTTSLTYINRFDYMTVDKL